MNIQREKGDDWRTSESDRGVERLSWTGGEHSVSEFRDCWILD